jgi:exopolysaccharide biosynthesis polyprenyl glycosylphosphotransferase
MLARRNAGLVSLFQAIVAVEAALLWIFLSHSGIRFSTLLPFWVYPIAVFTGVLVAAQAERNTSIANNVRPISLFDSTRLALRQVGFACASVFACVAMFKDPGISRFFLLIYFSLLGPILVMLNRHQPRWLTWRFFFDKQPVPTLFIGGSGGFPEFPIWIDNLRRIGAVPVGYIAYREQTLTLSGAPFLGGFEDLDRVMSDKKVAQVVMLDLPETTADAERLLDACLTHGSRLLIHNNFAYKLGYAFQMVNENNYSFLTLHDEPLEDPLNRVLKRGLDIVIATLVLLLFFPILTLIVAAMQRIQSPGPIFHTQDRTGHNHSRFKIWKFRSMHVSHEDINRQVDKDDARIFKFGGFLRRSSLDEIPQFINVLRGEMSTVGPRPHLVAHSQAFSRDIDVYLLRYFVKPGITGLAQCNGYRGITSTPETLRRRVQLDLEYIRTWSFWMDIVIIIKTARQIIFPPVSAR